MPVSQRLLTAAEFERMPEEPDVRMELVRGQVVRMTPAGFRHAAVAGRLFELLSGHARSSGIGRVLPPAGFRLASNPDTVREPDLAFVRQERLNKIGEPPGFYPGPPDLAIEIVSPTDRPSAIRAKVTQYLDLGVRMVWVVDPEAQTVGVHLPATSAVLLHAADTLGGGDVVPGFSCGVTAIFLTASS